MKTAAIYARVSTERQEREGTSLDTQEAMCRKYAEEHRLRVVEVVRESVSGSILNRPGLDRIRDMVERGEVHAVIVSEQDRLSRSRSHTFLFKDEFAQHGAVLLITEERYEDTDEGELHFGIIASFKEYERSKIKRRLRRGKEARSKQGFVVGSGMVPYGYRFVVGERRFEPVEHELRWVPLMYSWLVEGGMSLEGIARRLDENGVPTKRGAARWARQSVLSILRSPLYKGAWYWNKSGRDLRSTQKKRPADEWIKVPLQIEPVVSEELWAAVEAQLERNKHRTRLQTGRNYFLQGMISCGYCGYSLAACHVKNRKYYRCNGRYNLQRHLPLAERCPATSFDADNLDHIVWEEILRRINSPKLITDTLQDQVEAGAKGRARSDAELASFIRAAEAARQRIDRLVDLYTDGALDRATYDRKMALLVKEREAAERAVIEAKERATTHEQALANIAQIEVLCDKIRVGLPLLGANEKREFLRALDLRILATKDALEVTGRLHDTASTISLGGGTGERFYSSQHLPKELTRQPGGTACLGGRNCAAYRRCSISIPPGDKWHRRGTSENGCRGRQGIPGV